MKKSNRYDVSYLEEAQFEPMERFFKKIVDRAIKIKIDAAI